MKFLFKIILLTALVCSGAFAETNITSLERKVMDNMATQPKFPFNKSEVSSLPHSKPYMSKARSAIFRAILNPVYARSEKKFANMSSMTQ